jgi:hypothetical protein
MPDQPDLSGVDQRNVRRVVCMPLVPDDGGWNPSYVLAYTGSQLDTIDVTFAGITYQQTLTWTGSNLTAVSAWVEQ